MRSLVQSVSQLPSEIAKKAWRLVQGTFTVWSDRQAPRLGAAVAFYAIFSITPLVLMAVLVAGAYLGATFARIEFLNQLAGLLGQGAAEALDGRPCQPEVALL